MTMIRFEGLTGLGEVLENQGACVTHGLSVGATYQVTDITETTGNRNLYHYVDDNGNERRAVLKGNLFVFSIIDITH